MSNNQDSFDELEKAWNEPVLTIDTVGNFSCNFRYDEAGANISASADPQEELAHTTENSITPEKDDEIQFPLIEFINFDWLDPIDNCTPRLDSASDDDVRQSPSDEHVIQAPCPSIDLSADSHDPETEDLAAQARRMALRAGRGLSSAGTNSQVFIDEVIDTRVPSGHSVFRRPIEHLLGGRSEDSATEAQTMASNSARAASIAPSLQNPWLYKQATNADQHCQLTPRPSRPAVKTSVGGSSSYPHELFRNSTEHVAPDIELLTPFLDQHLPSEVDSYGHQYYGTDARTDYAYDYSQLSPSGTMASFIQELDEDEPEHSPLTSTLQVPRMGPLRRHSGAGVTTRQGIRKARSASPRYSRGTAHRPTRRGNPSNAIGLGREDLAESRQRESSQDPWLCTPRFPGEGSDFPDMSFNRDLIDEAGLLGFPEMDLGDPYIGGEDL